MNMATTVGLNGGWQPNSDPRLGFQPDQQYDLPYRGYREELCRGGGEHRHDICMDPGPMGVRYMGGMRSRRQIWGT